MSKLSTQRKQSKDLIRYFIDTLTDEAKKHGWSQIEIIELTNCWSMSYCKAYSVKPTIKYLFLYFGSSGTINAGDIWYLGGRVVAYKIINVSDPEVINKVISIINEE